ncbi:2-hydroxychromene-2-carboxylate isomerase [Bradyrhizobium sp. sBnM-33]|uniref:2-hydroxychromene-2-carboxylate isomerase n=1 Tax=Bradyrhizobium sp. sBnM-33 TaxID=2831780 RepID=UPI001BD067D0|nr:2-hydroxychromene-2-carboxylate isomerase [Bradyrhizobium sp. sBnM-33]WOH53354.1 2-hydroxychromene-2-carboxylate isomerase [Bradyrhizobium sp. sBnM-33]
MEHIDFYFDFLSPYGYLASTRIDALAKRHDCSVRWNPFRIGVAVVKVMGLRPNMETPLKAPYIERDIARLAAVLGVPLDPVEMKNPLPPAQLFYAAPPEIAGSLAKAIFRGQWSERRDMSEEANLIEIAKPFGMSEAEVRVAIRSPETRRLLKDVTEKAISRGVFGSPTFAIGKELFWGVDRMWLLDHYLSRGQRYTTVSPAADLEAFCCVPT